MFRKIAVSGILGSLIVAAPAFADTVKGVVVPVVGQASSFEPGPGTASKGDVVFAQKLVAKDTATLSAPLFFEKNNSFDSRYELKSGALLYKVGFPKFGTAFCSVDHGFSQKPKIGKPWDSQICLIDTDEDGRFDLKYAGATRKFDLSPLSLNMLYHDKSIKLDPIAYTVAGPNEGASVNARVELSKLSSKKLKFKVMIQLIEGDWSEHGEEVIKIEKGTAYPMTVDVYGASIRIDSIDKNSLSYEVLSGFPETETIGLE